ncbi:MAG TPA: PKD domain-containing protein, partial [Thermoplasmatales archaeon]|nr:PKD domain-containing protein [Thermoplasmatales archaeon]
NILNCLIYGNGDDGLDAPNVDTILIENTEIHDNGDNGAYMSNSQNHDLTNCDIYLNGHDGLHADTVSFIDLQTCNIHDNGNDGIYLHNSNNHNILNCLIYGNGDDGLDAPNVDTILIENTEIHDNSDDGAYMSNSQNHDILNSQVHSNGHDGVHAETASHITITSSDIYNNQNHGVYLTDSHDHSLYNNYMYSNHEDGIHAENVINTEINKCIISGNNGNGIYLKDTSNNDINNCGISGNYNGIYGDGVSDTTIQNNEIHSSKNNRGYGGAGIMFISDTNGFFNNVITNNNIYDNARQGIFLGWYNGIGNPVISTNNQITHNKIHHNGLDETHPPDASRYGIQLANADNNLIENNEIYDHYQWNIGVPWGAGIYLWASYENQVKNNHIYRNDQQVRCWSEGSQRTPGPNYINYNYFCKQYDEPCISPVVGVANYDFDTTAVVDARYNWWKAPSGPSSPPDENNYDIITGRIADGLGSQVIGPVNFDPWAGLDSLIKTSQTSALTGETIVFNAKDSFACHMDGTYYDHIVLWDFDDGTYSNEPQTGHVFTTPGTYRVSLRVEANDNTLWPNIMYDWSNITITISAPGQPLTANADSENLGGYKGVTGKPIQFYSSATGGKPPYTYYWDFGDCSNTVTEQNPTHVYSTAGTYTVTLTVIDTESNTATDTTTVTVNEPQPLQIDAGGPYTGNTGEKIWFSVTATGGIPPYTFEWDFGDNTPPAHGRSPTHTYKQPGTYTVTVTARDQIGATATGTTEAAVEEGNVEPEDNVKIQSLQGGLGLKATIQAGDVPVDWTITINGKLVFGETQSSGTIPANTVETVKTSRVFGLGPVDITVTANHATKEAEAFMIGPLVLSVKET